MKIVGLIKWCYYIKGHLHCPCKYQIRQVDNRITWFLWGNTWRKSSVWQTFFKTDHLVGKSYCHNYVIIYFISFSVSCKLPTVFSLYLFVFRVPCSIELYKSQCNQELLMLWIFMLICSRFQLNFLKTRCQMILVWWFMFHVTSSAMVTCSDVDPEYLFGGSPGSSFWKSVIYLNYVDKVRCFRYFVGVSVPKPW